MLWWFAQTTLIAGALAILATLASRWKRLGAEARYALWLVVLIKLAIPPIVAWPWRVPDAWPSRVESPPIVLPSPPPVVAEVAMPPVPASLPLPPPIETLLTEPSPAPRVEVEPPSPFSVSPIPEEVLAEVPPVSESRIPEISDFSSIDPGTEIRDPKPIARAIEITPPRPEIHNQKFEIWNLQSLILGLWLLGSLIVILRRGVKVVRFQRSLSKTSQAPAWLVEETRAIGERVGVRPPPVVMTSKVCTPLLWCLGRPRLIVPEALVKRLEADRWPGILAHELAHLARRDHWVVRLELLVEAAWWWNPLFWHVRRKLHEEAELACDARVIRSLPERRFAYAEALVDVCEHLARSAIPSPALGVGGAGASRSLEGRLLMILRDPIPSRPSRAAALVATLLAALALPAWTLGQQEPKLEAPLMPHPITSKPAIAPGTPQPLPPGTKPSDEAAEATIDEMRTAQSARSVSLRNLSFRMVVASREQTSRGYFPMGWMGNGMGGMGGGFRSMPPQFGGMGGMGGGVAQPTERLARVRVEVADVVLGFEQDRIQGSRVDILDALTDLAPSPGGAPNEIRWNRRFVANYGSIMTLKMASNATGPVPFRWLSGGGRQLTPGDPLAVWMIGNNANSSTDPDKAIDPLEPRPANLLDLAGSSTFFLRGDLAHAEVAGIDLIDGREAVRVAWIGNQDGLRGICWFAPELDFAPVRSHATLDPRPNQGLTRLTWRKQASDFVKVGVYWLPGKVAYEESEADPVGGVEPVYRKELSVVFDDFKQADEPDVKALRPKLAVQGIDDKTGQFTALPPELPVGLVQRLERAVRESPFGPPSKANGQPQVQLSFPQQASPTAQPPLQSVLVPAPVQPEGAMVPAPAQKDAAKADPGIIAQPKPGFEDPIPVSKPKIDDPIPVKDPGDRAAIDRDLLRLLGADPQIASMLPARVKLLQDQYDVAKRIAANADDPAVVVAKKNLDNLTKWYEVLMAKSQETRKLQGSTPIDRDAVAIMQARREGKAAELQKAEAQRRAALAVVIRNKDLVAKTLVGKGVLTMAEDQYAVADAEVASKKADLDEAEILLGQAKRTGSTSLPVSKAIEPSAVSPASTLVELRDAVELMEVQLLGKHAELQGVESKSDLANKQSQRVKELVLTKIVDQRLQSEAEDRFKLSQADLEQKKIEVREFEIRLKQARRRVEAEEGRLKREVARVKARFDWYEGLFKIGYVPAQMLAAERVDRVDYDELMLQLDPRYVPPALPAEGSTSKDEATPQPETPPK
jgi:beta-lactamase regulating signal transducer with metallopeptidase domain